MLSRIVGSLVSLGLLFSLLAGLVVAPIPTLAQKSQFQSIKQPLGLKAGITLGGLALIGVELWWFLLSKPKR